jgi:hypothetical protein
MVVNFSEVGWNGGGGLKDDKNNLFSYFNSLLSKLCHTLFFVSDCSAPGLLRHSLAWSKPLRVVQR